MNDYSHFIKWNNSIPDGNTSFISHTDMQYAYYYIDFHISVIITVSIFHKHVICSKVIISIFDVDVDPTMSQKQSTWRLDKGISAYKWKHLYMTFSSFCAISKIFDTLFAMKWMKPRA